MKTNQIYDYIERLGNLLRVDSRRDGAEHGLQPVQLEALHYLSVCNRYSDTPKATSEYLGQTKGTVSQTLKVLEKKGFLRKVTDDNDKRVVHLKLTSAGDKLLQQFIPSRQFKEACQHLSDESQTQIVSCLKELLQTTQRTNGMKTFGVCHSCRFNQKIKADRYFCNLTQEPLSSKEIQLICREHEEVV
ncbi:MAG: MarR family transcriptional regulator [Gammaproteobacteria bacterium]|nr:MarR family transcriptional regulator [Gammaproteobacteria bacterium]